MVGNVIGLKGLMLLEQVDCYMVKWLVLLKGLKRVES